MTPTNSNLIGCVLPATWDYLLAVVIRIPARIKGRPAYAEGYYYVKADEVA
jgi:hypothetical protein